MWYQIPIQPLYLSLTYSGALGITYNLSSVPCKYLWSTLPTCLFPIWGKGTILVSSLYLCQLNSDLHETLNLSSCATNHWSQVDYLQFGVTAPCLQGAILVSSYISANSTLIFMKFKAEAPVLQTNNPNLSICNLWWLPNVLKEPF